MFRRVRSLHEVCVRTCISSWPTCDLATPPPCHEIHVTSPVDAWRWRYSSSPSIKAMAGARGWPVTALTHGVAIFPFVCLFGSLFSPQVDSSCVWFERRRLCSTEFHDASHRCLNGNVFTASIRASLFISASEGNVFAACLRALQFARQFGFRSFIALCESLRGRIVRSLSEMPVPVSIWRRRSRRFNRVCT